MSSSHRGLLDSFLLDEVESFVIFDGALGFFANCSAAGFPGAAAVVAAVISAFRFAGENCNCLDAVGPALPAAAGGGVRLAILGVAT